MIEIRHLKLIKEIADTGNMTRAADKLFLTQPSLSHQLKEVESRLGTALFLRVNKKMILTSAGKKVLQAADDILPKMSKLEKGIQEPDELSVALRLSTKCSTCYHWLPTIIQKFQRIRQDITFDIVTEAMNDPIDFILKDQVDLALTATKTAERGVYYEKLFEDEQVLLVPADHPLARKKYVVPHDFQHENLIIHKDSLQADHFADKYLMPAGITLRKFTKMQSTEARLEMVKAGLGITVLSRWLTKPFLTGDARLREIRISNSGFYRTWYAAMLTEKRENIPMKQFVTFLKEQHRTE